jgi:hypothetical protein
MKVEIVRGLRMWKKCGRGTHREDRRHNGPEGVSIMIDGGLNGYPSGKISLPW